MAAGETAAGDTAAGETAAPEAVVDGRTVGGAPAVAELPQPAVAAASAVRMMAAVVMRMRRIEHPPGRYCGPPSQL